MVKLVSWIWWTKISTHSMKCQTSVSERKKYLICPNMEWIKTLTPICLRNFHIFLKLLNFFHSAALLVNMLFVTRITLSHNKISGEKKSQKWKIWWKLIIGVFLFLVLPPAIANLTNLEILNLSNNHLEELPLSLSSMPKLRILNCCINRLNSLPRYADMFDLWADRCRIIFFSVVSEHFQCSKSWIYPIII